MDECLALSAKCYGGLDGGGIFKVPRGKGNRHNILHAAGKGGWIPNLPLQVFDSAKYRTPRLERPLDWRAVQSKAPLIHTT